RQETETIGIIFKAEIKFSTKDNIANAIVVHGCQNKNKRERSVEDGDAMSSNEQERKGPRTKKPGTVEVEIFIEASSRKASKSPSSLVRRQATESAPMPLARDVDVSAPSELGAADLTLERATQSHQQETLRNNLPVLSPTGQSQRPPEAVSNQIMEQLMHAEERMRIFHQEDILRHEAIVMNLTAKLDELMQEDQGSTNVWRARHLPQEAEIVHQVAYDAAYRVPFILQHFADLKVIKDGINVSVGIITEDRKGNRFNMSTSAATTVLLVNFFNEALVVNNRESLTDEVYATRDMDFLKLYQEYCCRFPIANQGFLSEDEIVDVAKMSSIRFAKSIAYGIKMHNVDIDAKTWLVGAETASRKEKHWMHGWACDSGRVVNESRSTTSIPQGPQHPAFEVNDGLLQVMDRSVRGTVEHTFVFGKENMTLCRGKIIHAESDPNHLPPAYDKTPKFAHNMEGGTAPIEHYVRRVVTYLARLQSVTQNTDYGLALKVYVNMGIRGNHNDEDVNMNIDNEATAAERQRENALRATKEMRRSLAIGGSADAVVFENLAIMLHESSVDARSNMESTLKRVYVQHIAEILKLVPRPPIVMINHDKRFFACAHKTLRRREDVVGYDAVGAYLALELRMRGCVVVHGPRNRTTSASSQGVCNLREAALCETMITACYLNSEGLREWQKLLHHRTVNIPQFREIWMDTTKLHFAPTVDADAWISPERLQAIREEHRRNDIVRRPGASWQNFEVFCRDETSFAAADAQPEYRIGCDYKHFNNTTYYRIKNYGELRKSEMYALACSNYIYTHMMQDVRPSDDLLEFIRKCCPIAYNAVGKVVSAYGGLRCTPAYARVYPEWAKAKQLSWDRAYDSQNNPCFIGYLMLEMYAKKWEKRTNDPAIENDVLEILRALPTRRFLVVPTSITLQPHVGATEQGADERDDTNFDSSRGVDVPRLVPEEITMEGGQPDEEITDTVQDAEQDADIVDAAKARAWDALNMLFIGNIEVDAVSIGTLCIGKFSSSSSTRS
ncbi:unnamed protein product, partial [Symbiodinium sp. KB8]